jgi:hypothetical protein
MLNASGREVLNIPISASGDDEARDKARALSMGKPSISGTAFGSSNGSNRLIFFRDPKYSMQSEVHD